MRRRYVQIDGELVEVTNDYVGEPRASHYVMPDIQPYQSQVTGEMITSRSQHREHLKTHRLVEIGNETKYLKNKPVQPPPGLRDTLGRVVYQKLGG